MKSSSRLIAGLTLTSFVFAAPVAALDSGSMAVGNATVTVGGGTAILTLPDVPSFLVATSNVAPFPPIITYKFSDDFDDEFGWNVNGSIAVPMTGANGRSKEVSLNGFWSNIEDDSSFSCNQTAGQLCAVFPIVDAPAGFQFFGTAAGDLVSNAERNVDHWGVSLESKWQLSPNVMGVTRAPRERHFALGADVRGIDQDLDVRIVGANGAPAGTGTFTYDEQLDTRYYGVYAAWGGDYALPFLSGLTNGLGLRSSFQLRGGVYYADTDYEGRLVATNTVSGNPSSALSLSEDDVAFIGGLVLETRKQIGRRASLSLKSEYEYYSHVPEIAYNQVDRFVGGLGGAGFGGQVGTVINDDDAFSAKTSLRLTIKLGPDSIMEPQ